MEACTNCPDIDSNATAVSSKSSNFANVSWFNDIDSNVTLSNFFDDIVMPTKPRKEKIECFGCSG